MARFLMRRASLVHSRDAAGIEEIRKLLGEPEQQDKARFCFDLGFVVEPQAPPRLELGGLLPRARPQRPLVGLNASGLLLAGNGFGLRIDYATLVEQLIERLIDERGVEVLLVPHVFSGDAECDVAAAAALHERLRPRCGTHLFRVHGHHDQHQIKHVIGLCDFFIGSRMHACIAALSQCIPAVGIAYSDKFAGVFESVGVGALVIDPRHVTMAEACRQVLRAYDDRAQARAQLVAAMPGIRSGVMTLLDGVA
jgi:polysaccharide pyruvyl transferase WcaK-like protein